MIQMNFWMSFRETNLVLWSRIFYSSSLVKFLDLNSNQGPIYYENLRVHPPRLERGTPEV